MSAVMVAVWRDWTRLQGKTNGQTHQRRIEAVTVTVLTKSVYQAGGPSPISFIARTWAIHGSHVAALRIAGAA